MRNAGASVASVIRKKFPESRKILVICGSGNKAGDAIHAAKHLMDSYELKFYFIKGKTHIKNAEAAKIIKEMDPEIVSSGSLERSISDTDIIVDALLGTGIVGDPSKEYAQVIDGINSSGKIIVSIDVPSGIGTSKQVKPAVTVALHSVKEPCTRKNSGELVVKDIGIDPETMFSCGPGEILRYPFPSSSSHKGMNGTLAIIAGLTFPGAGIVSSLGAEKVGIDLLKFFTADVFVSAAVNYSPFIMPQTLHPDRVSDQIEGADAVLIGPGLGQEKSRIDLLSHVLSMNLPTIIDADGLKLLPHVQCQRKEPLILTPHSREFEIMAGNPATDKNILKYASETSSIVLVKGEVDRISDGKDIYRTVGGNARMTMGGTGDLLAGIVAALVAKGMEPLPAAKLGSFINKKCGDRCFDRLSYWYGIMDMINEIPTTMKWCYEYAKGKQ